MDPSMYHSPMAAPRRRLSVFFFLVVLVIVAAPVFSEPSPAATAAFNAYVATVEARLALQHSSAEFLAPVDSAQQADLHRGELVISHLSPPGGDPLGAIIHHWRATAFAPGAHIADLEQALRDFPAYSRMYAPQVVRATILSQRGDRYRVSMRLRQQHVITVVLDTTYDVSFARLDARHLYTLSRSTQVSEIESAGTSHERALSPANDHGFLWRINTYWSCEERDAGLYLQVESISLTRSIPAGLGWAVRPFIDSVPRQSLEFTLRSTINALDVKSSASTTSRRRYLTEGLAGSATAVPESRSKPSV